MTQKGILNMITFGFWEFQLTIIFSLVTFIAMLIQEIFYPVIIYSAIFAIDFVILILHLWNRQKAKAFLIARVIRVSLLIVVITLSQQVNANMEPPDIYTAIVSVVLSACLIVFLYFFNSKEWNKIFETWQQTKKIDSKHREFSIMAFTNNGVIMDSKANLKQALEIIVFTAIGCFLSWAIGKFISHEFPCTIISVCGILLIYVFSKGLAYQIFWIIKIIKLEKEMNIEILSEYADKTKLAKMSRSN